MPPIMWACPQSKQTPMSSKCMVRMNSTRRSGVEVRWEYFPRALGRRAASEGAQVLNTGHGGFEFSFVEFFVGIADVLDQKANGICSAISRARLISSMASIRWARSVEAMLTGGEPVRPPFVIRIQRAWTEFTECQWSGTSRQFRGHAVCGWRSRSAAGGEDFDRLGSGFDKLIEQARMEAVPSHRRTSIPPLHQ